MKDMKNRNTRQGEVSGLQSTVCNSLINCRLKGITYPYHHRNVLLAVIGAIEGYPFRAIRLPWVTYFQSEVGTQQDELEVKPQAKAGTHGNVIGE